MRTIFLAAAASAVAGPAGAQGVTLTPLADVRTRYEHVDQDGTARTADAVTIRARGGVSAEAGGFSALAEAQGTLAVVDRYFDGLHGAATYPLVSDPQNVALFRAQMRYARPGFAVTAGRQRIAIDDDRFVGSAPFRDNAQTFDAVRVEWNPAARLKTDISYAWSVRTIWGIDGGGARQQAVSGDKIFANVAYRTAIGTFAGFAYLIDQDEAAVQGYRLSSRTLGVRFAGTRTLNARARLSYQASYARQSDWRRNPDDHDATYYMVDAALDLDRLRIGAGYEVLGADRGAALTSFQTPLASGFKFQGWADKFLTTPPDGVRDLYGSVGYALKTGGAIGTVNLQAVYHRFDSDRLVRRYGDEFDALASIKAGRTLLSVRYAGYRARGFATDTRKLWFQADWSL